MSEPESLGVRAGEYFASICAQYDGMIVRCVPRYEEMLDQLLDVIPQELAGGRVLELGSGSGALTCRYLARYPTAQVTAVDASGEMLRACRTRCNDFGGACEPRMVCAQFESLPLGTEAFDLVVSSISLHHVEDKPALFRRVRELLNPTGVLVFADQFRGASERIHQRNWSRWLGFCEAAGAPPAEIQSWLDHAAQHDHHESVPAHFEFLRAAGFTSADCVWRHLIWGIVCAEV